MAEIISAVDLSMLTRFGNAEQILSLMEPHIKNALNVTKGAVRERTPTGSKGLLRRSIGYEFSRVAGDAVGRLYVVGDANEYAPFVEYGRLPGAFPPWGVDSPLYAWVRNKITGKAAVTKATKRGERGYTYRDKNGKVIALKNKKGKEVKLTEAGKQTLTISFLIARSIARKGTYMSSKTPQGAPHMFELGWEETKEQAMDIVQDGIGKVLTQLVTGP